MPLSKRNRRGLIFILVICLIIAVTPRLLNSMSSVAPPVITHEEAVEVHRSYVNAEKNRVDYSRAKKEFRYISPKKSVLSPGCAFDTMS